MYLEAEHLAASQACVFVFPAEAAGPLKAKMVSYKLQFLPSVSSLPLGDHRAFQIEPELNLKHSRRESRRGFCVSRGNDSAPGMMIVQCNEVVVAKLFH